MARVSYRAKRSYVWDWGAAAFHLEASSAFRYSVCGVVTSLSSLLSLSECCLLPFACFLLFFFLHVSAKKINKKQMFISRNTAGKSGGASIEIGGRTCTLGILR